MLSPPALSVPRYARNADALLDLACGRGGDIWKWIDSNIKYVKGVDLSPGEIAEARQRYLEAVAKRPGRVTLCEFEDTSKLGVEEWRDERQYDVITCMFALHYFFVSEAALRQFLQNVAINLLPGGYFIGTVPDGKRINECIRSSRVYESPMLRIEARWAGAPATFGSPYLCSIGDTVTGDERGTEGSLEYLVYQNVLVGVASQCGLEPVLDYEDLDLEAHFDPQDKQRLLKHFAPRFPGSDPSLERASALFAAFAFKKKVVDYAEEHTTEKSAAADQRQKRKRDEIQMEIKDINPTDGALEELQGTAALYKRPPPRRKAHAAGSDSKQTKPDRTLPSNANPASNT